MPDAPQKVIDSLDRFANRKFPIHERLEQLKQDFRAKELKLKASKAKILGRLIERLEPIDNGVWALVDANRDTLFEPGKRSFATLFAIFQLKYVPATVKVADRAEAKIMAAAYKHGFVKKVADQQYVFNPDKFLALIEENPDLEKFFPDCIVRTPAGDTMSMKPNETYFVRHGKKRISPKAYPVKKS